MSQQKKPKKPRELHSLWAIIGRKGGAFIDKKYKRVKQKLKKLIENE